jgi:hypothetical protein
MVRLIFLISQDDDLLREGMGRLRRVRIEYLPIA